MKRYFIPMLIAAVALLVSCSEDFKPSYLGTVKVSESIVPLPASGTSETGYDVQLHATADWEITGIPEWLTVTPSSGTAGDVTLYFKADAVTASREANLKIVCAGTTQELLVMQVTKKADVPLSTCAQVLAGEDGKTFRAKGTVARIANTTYGNWYLNDGTGEVYIYGTLDKNGGEKNFLSLGIDVGDIVTVEGPKTTYNGTVELVNVSVISIEKSLLKIDSLDIKGNIIPKQGGQFNAVLENKGEGVSVNISDDAKDWLFISGININGTTTVVTFRALPNESAGRTATIGFSTTSGGKKYAAETTVKQEGVSSPASGKGTKAEPYNVAGMLAFVKALGADTESEADIYVKGKISSVKYTYSAQFGTATYNISDDGKEDNVFTVYGSYFFDNKPWEEGQSQIKVGDEVVVAGKAIYYKGTTPEFANKKNWLVSLNGKTE
jgi:hypothetical protein